MKQAWRLLLLTALPLAAAAAELTGTPYTVLYRGPVGGPATAAAPARGLPRPPVYGGLRLVEGRSGRELARSDFDPQLGGYLFRLPFGADLARGPVCLLLKGPSGASLPLRDESAGDDGYAFRNPPWEAEVLRQGELVQWRAERAQLLAQIDASAQELPRLQTEAAASGGPGAACTTPAAEPDPPRPPGALTPAEAQAKAGGLCALKWERFLAAQKVDAARLFADAGAGADWAGREDARSLPELVAALHIVVPEADRRLVLDAAAKGRAFLEHAEGVRIFARAQAACRDDVPRLAQASLAQWEAQVAQVRQAPLRARQQCDARLARIEQLRAAQASAPAYRAELDRRVAALEAGVPAATAPRRLDRLPCKDL